MTDRSRFSRPQTVPLRLPSITWGLTAEELLADTETLTSILTFHVVEGEVSASQLTQLIVDGGGTAEVETLNGAMLTAQLTEDGVIVLNGQGFRLMCRTSARLTA